ncbi:MAG: DnaJ domain-containing protein [Cyanosarcina radialis HA8281-LM2]|jgi:WD40 repeat protein|nr:DnaJ domain-containing protein [Cyanosarcina radialis HA8281-LM2]
MATNSAPGAAFVTGGAATGAWVSVTLGGMGLSFSGTAVGLGIAPVTAAGAVAGAASYGVFRAIVEGDASAFSAAALGGLGGAGVSVTVGGMGLAFKGTAISLGIAPITVAGAVVGLAVYGLLKIIDRPGSQESVAQVFERMEDKISWQEAYNQALQELSPLLAELAWQQKFAALEIEEELQLLKAQTLEKSISTDKIEQELQSIAAQISALQDNGNLNFTKFKNVEFTAESELKLTAIAPKKSQSWQQKNILKGHLSTVNSVAISHDDRTLASSSDDRTVKLWDLNSGKHLFTFMGQEKEAAAVAISPNGQTIVSGSFDSKITAWNFKAKTFLRTFFYLNSASSHSGFIYSVAYSPDGSKVISGGGDRLIRIWNAHTGQILRTLNGHTDSVLSVVISPDGQTIASSSSDRTIKIWRLIDGGLVRTLTGHSGWVFSVAIDSDGKILASGSRDGTIKLWNLCTGELIRTLSSHTAGVFSVALSCDRQTLASGSNDGTVKLWNLNTGELLQTLASSYPVAFSIDGKILVSGNGKGQIAIWHQTISSDESTVDSILSGDWWQVLKIEPNASLNEAKQAYRRLAREYHPDLNPTSNAKFYMQAINRAYREFRKEFKQKKLV